MNPEKFDFREAIMTSRDISEYIQHLDITQEDLDNPDTLILDLGAGAKQDLARDVREAGLKSKIFSVDPRLSLPMEEDVDRTGSFHQMDRIEGRMNPEPNSVAAVSEALPFPDNTFHKILALYSVPHYLKLGEIKENIDEIIRVLKSGGEYKAFPVEKERMPIVENLLNERNDITFSIMQKDTDSGLLVIQKK